MDLARPLAILLLVAISFAGCADKGDKGKDDDGDGDDGGATGTGTRTSTGTSTQPGSGTSSGSGTATGGPGPNRAPTTSLAASVANGTVPLNVTFTVTATDPDGDNVTWDLRFGDGESAQGAGSGKANHTFDEAGNYTVVLNVSDGARSASANLTIEVSMGGGSANSFIVTLTDICAPPTTTCTNAPNGCPDFARRTPGTFCAWFPIPAELRGKAFTLTSTSGDPDGAFTSSPSGACAFPANQASRVVFDEVGPEAGTIPATSPTGGFAIDCLTVIEFEAKPSTITFAWTP